jgi:hypothetical protein
LAHRLYQDRAAGTRLGTPQSSPLTLEKACSMGLRSGE